MKKLPDLSNFHGTEYYHKLTMIPGFVCTDGVAYLAKEAGAFWLIDVIASHGIKFRRTEDFMVAKLTVKDEKATFELNDGNGNILATQEIEYTDFPEPGIELVIENGGDFHVIMLWGGER
jgi:hypothetical protein